MTQTSQMTRTLKRCLRARGYTYRDLAGALELSESSVKRLFSEQTFTLQRLEEICRFLQMSVFDLSRLAAAGQDERRDELSEAQEVALADDPLLLSYFYLLLIGWKPLRISRRLALDEVQHRDCLAALASAGLVELLPRHRVRLLTDTRIRWRPDGPIREKYEGQVKAEFVDHEFKGPQELLELQNGELSEASIRVLLKKLGRLAEEFSELVELDRHLPPSQKRGFGLLIGARSWTFWNTIGRLPQID